MDDNDPTQEPGDTIGTTSGVRIDPPSTGGPTAEPKAVLFVADDVDVSELLDGIEVVRVNEDVILDQVRRRT